MTDIPFLDLRAQHAPIRGELDAAIGEVLDSCSFVLGPAVQSFEEAFAEFCGVRHVVALNTGTSALHLALLAAGIGPGDEVIAPAMTFVASVAAIEYTGATPVLVDVTPDTWTIDPEAVEAAITSRTTAIMPVHLHGLMANLDRLGEIASRHGVLVIEDAAQAHGASWGEQAAGTWGLASGFSFYPGKNLGACGEGGAMVTDDDGVADRARMLRDWGAREKYHHELPGFNFRMDGIQGAVLGVKLRHLAGWTEQRRRVAALYDERLDEIGVTRPTPPAGVSHVYHVYAVCVPDRNRLQSELSAAGIGSGCHYPIPVHLQPAYRRWGAGEGTLPVSEALAATFLSLPMFPEMTEAQVDRVVGVVAQAL